MSNPEAYARPQMPRKNRTSDLAGHLATAKKPGDPRALQHEAAARTGRNELRIIGGEWRGRRLRFPADTGIRPTPDRVRETLFNWLQLRLAGRRCLDLFAGSGALGLEALSRGAGEALFIERDARIVQHLSDALQGFGCTRGQVLQADALAHLAGPASRFDVIFVDPPYALQLQAPICALIEAGGWLAPEGLVYIECAARDGEPALPAGWELLRSRRAGDVGYHLAARRPGQRRSESQ